MSESNRPADSFEQQVLKYEDALYRIALAMMKNKPDAEDVLQEVFLKLFEKKTIFESAEHEKAWLIRVTINLCKSKFRYAFRKREETLLDIYPAKSEQQNSLIEQVMQLPPKYRAVIHLFYYEGYTTGEIAQITRQKEGTVRSLMSRARKKLKLMLTELEYGGLYE